MAVFFRHIGVSWLLAGCCALLLLGLVSPARAQKVVVENHVEVRQVPAFRSINVGGAVDVIISYAAETKVVVSASDDRLLQQIQTSVVDGILSIAYKSPSMVTNSKKYMRVYVATPTLSSVVGSGASDIILDGTLQADDLELVLSGASNLTGTIKTNRLRLVGSGSADFKISGQSEELVITMSGASDVAGKGFTTRRCVVNVSGSSDVHIGVQNELIANASGTSDIRYYGNPSVKELKATTASTIRPGN